MFIPDNFRKEQGFKRGKRKAINDVKKRSFWPRGGSSGFDRIGFPFYGLKQTEQETSSVLAAGDRAIRRRKSFCLSYWVDFIFSVGAKLFALVLVGALFFNNILFVKAPVGESGTVIWADTIEERRQLEQRLSEIEKQIEQYEQEIQITQGQKQTLANEIKILDRQIAKINLEIKMLDLEVRRLSLRISDLGISIKGSENKINRARDILRQSLQNLYEIDRISLLEVLASKNNLSEFFNDLNIQTAVQVAVQDELDQIRLLKRDLESQQSDLIMRREDRQALSQLQAAQRRQLAEKKKEKDQLLSLTKGKEALYQQLIKQSQKSASEIRAQLYKLIGGGEIKFEDALRYAEFASQYTGVRPALLLAVLDAESALGKNVGRCTWEKAMHPTRDKPLFLQITSELGLNPDTVPVSCPILSDGAYGGAMGIAQFLPSTWMIYKRRIQAITGTVPSPWNPRDAFVATSLYLSDAGAGKGDYTNERIAAARYYAGNRWRYYLRSYGDRVLELARQYENQINILKRSAFDILSREISFLFIAGQDTSDNKFL